AGRQGVTRQAVAGQCAPQPVVDLLAVAGPPFTVPAVSAGIEVAQVAGQLAAAQHEIVAQAHEVLLIVVVQSAEVVLGDQIPGDRVVATGEQEIAFLGATLGGQAGTVAGGAAGSLVQVAQVQGQALQVLAGQLCTLEGLRQQAAIVADQHRQAGLQGTDAHFGLAGPGLAGQTQAAELIGRRPAIQREQLAAVVGRIRVQADAQQALGVQPEAHRAFREPGTGIEDEALTPLIQVVGVVVEVLLEVEVARVQADAAVFEESRGGCLLGGDGGGDGQREGRSVHAQCSEIPGSVFLARGIEANGKARQRYPAKTIGTVRWSAVGGATVGQLAPNEEGICFYFLITNRSYPEHPLWTSRQRSGRRRKSRPAPGPYNRPCFRP